jgi:hypothetical protein
VPKIRTIRRMMRSILKTPFNENLRAPGFRA